MASAVTVTLLEKAATDNGFDLDLGHENDWLAFGGSQTKMRVWLSATVDSEFVAATSRADVIAALSEHGVAPTGPLPDGPAGALRVGDIASLHRLLRRAFQLSRCLTRCSTLSRERR